MRLYNYNQNNSGGTLTINESVHTDTLIEAKSAKKANKKIQKVSEIDFYEGCSCCGTRWKEIWDYYDDPFEPDNHVTFEFRDKQEAITYFSEKKKGNYDLGCIIYFKDKTKEIITYKD